MGPTRMLLSKPVIAAIEGHAVAGETDRLSCHRQWDTTLDEALRFEGREGERPLRDEASRGAARFSSGLGRGGTFDAI
jgi:enoyl-CoA hydratase